MAIGSYAIEKDYSYYVSSLANTVYAVVGTASKGPIGVPTACTSSQDLISKFGPLKTDCYGLYAGQYFLSQSSKMYFVRAAKDTAAEATATIAGKGASDATVSDAVTVKAIEKGTYANGYKIEVAAVTGSADKYDLTIKSAAGSTLETIKGVTIEDLVVGYKKSQFQVSAVNSSAAKLTTGSYTFASGNDGITGIAAADYISAANSLAADTIDMNLFAIPGVSDASVITAMLSLAETRGDCLYLVDPPKGLTRDGVINWHNGSGDYQHVAFNSSYGALYYDWVIIYDSVNKQNVTVPPSVVVAPVLAYSDRTSEIWYAPAGLTRGVVRGVLESETKLSKTDTELLYEGANNINPLYDDPQSGLVVWGQKTLYRENTALNRINVRRLTNYLKKTITTVCNYLTFEPNDRITWNSFEMKIQPLLDSIKNRRGIYEYEIVKGETIVTEEDIDNYSMPCMILFRPTKAAETIPIHFVITSTGADFNEVLEANGVLSL